MKIVDGNNDWMDLLPMFSEMYNNPEIRVSSIKEELGLNENTYNKLRREAYETGLIELRPVYNKPKKKRNYTPKNYYHGVVKGIDYWYVVKRINGERITYGNFKKPAYAERMVELLEEHNWDVSLKKVLKEQVLDEARRGVL